MQPDHHIVVEYSADRKLAINKGPVEFKDLEQRLREIYQDRRDKTLYVSGADVTRVGVITESMRRAAAGGA